MGSAADRMKQMGDKLQERTKESYDRKDEYGPSFTYFKKEGQIKTASGELVNVKDISVWKPKVAVHVFDIVPSFAGANWPLDNHGIKLAEGEPVYVLDVPVHTNVGASDAQFICLSRYLGLPCPICEHQAELKKEIDYDQELVKGLYPKRRNVYNVICFDSTEEEDKGVQVFECAQFFMEAKLTPLAFDARTKALVPYAHYSKGKTIQFEIKQKTYTTKLPGGGEKSSKGSDYIGHKLLDRPEPLMDQDLDDAYILDDLIHVPTYEEVFKAYWAGIRDLPESHEDTSTGAARRRRTPLSEPEKQEIQETATGAGRRRRTSPVEEKKETGSSSGCPLKGKFGEDIDKLDGCNSCDVYDPCALKAEELKKVPAPAKGSEDAPAGGARRRRRPGQ